MLTLSHRPTTFAELVGQQSARAILQALVFGGDMPAAVLLTGPSGTGKTTAARVLAAALNCPSAKNGDCCGACTSCRAIQAGDSVAVHEIDAASYGGVDDVRALQELVQFSTTSAWRVVILDEAHAMSRAAFNALLKVLEQPPPATVFALLTTEPEKIMATVRSRTMPISFKPVPTAVITERLIDICVAQQISLPREVLGEIADQADGAVRDAVMLLDQAHRVGISDVAGLRDLLGRTDLPLQILDALLAGDLKLAREHLTAYLTVSADLPGLISELIAALHGRYQQTTAITPRQLIAATKLLWDARTVGHSTGRSARNQTEALITLLSAVLKPPADAPIPRSAKSPEEPPEPRRVQLDELAELVSS